MFIISNQFNLNMSKNHISKNRNKKTIYNIGFLGEGIYNSNGEYFKIYNIWHSIIKRCYSEKEQLKRALSYIGCSVMEEWHNYQNFAKWYIENYVDNYHLDKDILIKGNKIYGPITCCFVPTQINSLFIKASTKKGNLPIGVSKHRLKFQVQLKKYGEQNNYGQYNTSLEAFLVYKFEKEIYIKEVAEIWKDKISNNVYKALINYNVEITD